MLNSNRQGGFTLIELMVTMAITVIVLAAIFEAYQSQLRTNTTQQRIVEMNQGLRTAMLMIETDLRMAGLNPTGSEDGGILQANSTDLVMAIDDGGTNNECGNVNNALDDNEDNNGNGLIDEGCDGVDNDGDGLIDEADEWEWYDGDITDRGEVVLYDLNNGNLRRRLNAPESDDPTTGSTTWVATNIDALNFVYFDGEDPPNVIPAPVDSDELENIRYVQVSVVARGGATVPVLARLQTDDTVYRNPQGDIILDKSADPDNFRRQMATAFYKCRNMGLE